MWRFVFWFSIVLSIPAVARAQSEKAPLPVRRNLEVLKVAFAQAPAKTLGELISGLRPYLHPQDRKPLTASIPAKVRQMRMGRMDFVANKVLLNNGRESSVIEFGHPVFLKVNGIKVPSHVLNKLSPLALGMYLRDERARQPRKLSWVDWLMSALLPQATAQAAGVVPGSDLYRQGIPFGAGFYAIPPLDMQAAYLGYFTRARNSTDYFGGTLGGFQSCCPVNSIFCQQFQCAQPGNNFNALQSINGLAPGQSAVR